MSSSYPAAEPSVAPFIVKYPFDDETADLILQSSDSVNFYVHRTLLSLLSPVFQTMFTLPQEPSESDANKRPIIEMAEDASTLQTVLPWCDPRCVPVFETISDAQPVLEFADKYDLEHIKNRVGWLLKSITGIIDADPVKAFAIAVRYELEELARSAAKQTLCLTLDERPNITELRFITASSLQHLHDYYCACRAAAQKIVTEVGWAAADPTTLRFRSGAGEHTCSYPCWGARSEYDWRLWWIQYMDFAAMQLYLRPCSGTIEKLLATAPMQKAYDCSQCRPTVQSDILAFNKVFAKEVDRVVSSVSALSRAILVLNFTSCQIPLVLEFGT